MTMGNLPASSSRASRLTFLDLFRGLAVFGMFDAHITNALVIHPEGWNALYYYHDKLFNLPAPAFLFAAGIPFGMSIDRRWNDYRSWSPVLRNRLLRLAEILLLGLALHLPFFSLHRTLFEATERQMSSFRNMDVLQCIAVSAFALLVLVWVLPSPRWFLRACFTAAIGISVASPLMWALSPQLPWWLGTYFSKHWGSFFPLFPYAGFLFAGAVWGYLYADAKRNEGASDFLKSSGRLGLLLLVAGAAAGFLPLPAPYDDFWNASPQFFLLRVGFFSAVLSLLARTESRVSSAVPFLAPLGSESLVIYMTHLVMIYGSLANPIWNLRKMIGPGIGFWGWLMIYALLTVAMTLLAKAWTLMKEKLDWRADWLEWSLAACLVVYFVVQ
jgi:hypothetical protein